MIKILLITAGILLVFFFIVTSFATGFLRGIKLLSTRNVETSPLEVRLLKQYFKQNKDIDPFFYSLYMKDTMKQNTEALKVKHQNEVKKNKSLTLSGEWINKRSKKVWSIDKVHSENIIVSRNNIIKSIAKNSFIKNWKKV